VLSKRKWKWETAGYIGWNRAKTCLIIKVYNPETGGDYYITQVPDVTEVIAQKSGYAKIYKRRGS